MPRPRHFPALVAVLLSLGACGSAARAPQGASFQMGPEAAMTRARVDSLRYPYTQADIDFMSGMIHHHAQAIVISRWAPSHDAGAAVQRLTARIINAQGDEINLMQTWLRDRNQAPPEVDAAGVVTMPHGAHGEHEGHAMAMPGMLSDGQMRELDAARGSEFDRIFLTYMIQHHRGAITMVRALFASRGAGQDETIFKFAADVEVDQSTEISRMLQMLLEHDGATRSQ